MDASDLLASLDPGSLSPEERVDLLVVLEEQRRWFEAAQLRVLAVMQERDSSKRGWAQESVSLALQVPLRTAQGKLAQARTLVRELPRTLTAVSDGAISGEHARVIAEAVWRLPEDPALPAALEAAVLPPLLEGRCVTVPQFRARVRRACWPWTRSPPRSATNAPSPIAPSGTCRARTAWSPCPSSWAHRKPN